MTKNMKEKFKPATSSVRNQDATTLPATYLTARTFKLAPIQASVIYQIPWIHWISIPVRKNLHTWKGLLLHKRKSLTLLINKLLIFLLIFLKFGQMMGYSSVWALWTVVYLCHWAHNNFLKSTFSLVLLEVSGDLKSRNNIVWRSSKNLTCFLQPQILLFLLLNLKLFYPGYLGH